MDVYELAHRVELLVSLGIFVVGSVLTAVSGLAWMREREPRMAWVTTGYGAFAVGGAFAMVEPWLARHVAYSTAELLEGLAGVFYLVGLLLLFWALARR